ncbi:hypothetical protein AK812_SmicGene77 [Symbiodinium microadriaticum]|uniref:Uncharacterized protein n=1 Tax=Symbiodinium microadriaticum TaxID=2951 RepID=A0A1Q9F7S4_SYMMI|nr:hypothetical protein AK812_SmicGene77 [Symbiodinium microadriaticum]
MPGRACRDTSYRQQHQIECSLVTSTPRVGLSVDIVKCFNQLGWGPICALLLRLGVPEAEVHFWASCLRHHTRCSVFHNDISAGIPCHNGAPEGDPMSVVAMVAVCRLADAVCHHALVDYESYVDNWAWSSADRAALATVIPRALDLLQSLRLPIDFKKSYIWATKRQDRLWWQRSAPTLFPEGCLPALVSEVRDLGVAFKYDGHGHRASRNHRLQSGLDRIDRLRSQPRPPLNKAHLVQAGIWPQCLYGAESHVHTRAELQSLRGRAARAIVGNYAALSPHLTFALLAERVQDPQMYCLERQLALLRRACLYDPDTALSILDMATAPVPPRTAQGPATSLRLSLDRLGPRAPLLQRSWALHVQDLVAHRNGLLQAPPVLLGLLADKGITVIPYILQQVLQPCRAWQIIRVGCEASDAESPDREAGCITLGRTDGRPFLTKLAQDSRLGREPCAAALAEATREGMNASHLTNTQTAQHGGDFNIRVIPTCAVGAGKTGVFPTLDWPLHATATALTGEAAVRNAAGAIHGGTAVWLAAATGRVPQGKEVRMQQRRVMARAVFAGTVSAAEPEETPVRQCGNDAKINTTATNNKGHVNDKGKIKD